MSGELKRAATDLTSAAQDVVNAGFRSGEEALRRFAEAVDAAPIAELCRAALPGVDFAEWLQGVAATRGSMAASGRLSWPADKHQRVAIQLALMTSMARQELITLTGLLDHFFSTRREQAYAEFVRTLFGPFFRDLGQILSDAQEQQKPVSTANADPAKIFVVHGRNKAARDAMFAFLRSIGLKPLEWTEAVSLTGSASPYVGDVLESAFAIAQAVVVLMTGDDEAQLREALQTTADDDHERRLTPQARANVLFEAGMAFGSHPKRTLLVELGKLRPFSDVAGRHVVRLSNATEARQGLAMRLRDAGCSVSLEGTDWHTSGDFESAIK